MIVALSGGYSCRARRGDQAAGLELRGLPRGGGTARSTSERGNRGRQNGRGGDAARPAQVEIAYHPVAQKETRPRPGAVADVRRQQRQDPPAFEMLGLERLAQTDALARTAEASAEVDVLDRGAAEGL